MPLPVCQVGRASAPRDCPFPNRDGRTARRARCPWRDCAGIARGFCVFVVLDTPGEPSLNGRRRSLRSSPPRPRRLRRDVETSAGAACRRAGRGPRTRIPARAGSWVGTAGCARRLRPGQARRAARSSLRKEPASATTDPPGRQPQYKAASPDTRVADAQTPSRRARWVGGARRRERRESSRCTGSQCSS